MSEDIRLDRLLYNSMSDDDARGAVWLTNESPPREVKVEGTAAIDPDVFVASSESHDGVLWIVKSSGYVCGLGGLAQRVVARPEARAG